MYIVGYSRVKDKVENFIKNINNYDIFSVNKNNVYLFKNNYFFTINKKQKWVEVHPNCEHIFNLIFMGYYNSDIGNNVFIDKNFTYQAFSVDDIKYIIKTFNLKTNLYITDRYVERLTGIRKDDFTKSFDAISDEYVSAVRSLWLQRKLKQKTQSKKIIKV
jgi:hypothetical protein